MSNAKSPPPDDWRRQGQERDLLGAALIRRAYQPPSEQWDHDHCEFCWAKFSLRDGDLHEGYCTPDTYHWICDACFNDFRDEFRWRLEQSRP